MAGKIVETKTGLIGQTSSTDKLVNGKVLVYLGDNKKMLCDPKKLKVIGFWD